ncbi:ChuX/HutX family heme-like substrate-binding protein [Piscinibacter sakaiensis]|uniref:hemin-degrading factor n=1 Tax=Piscinibacter sakaiensis TaxID=1547922 RepID=UPI0037299DA2
MIDAPEALRETIAAHLAMPAARPDEPCLQATRLQPRWPRIVAALPALGRVMALTRNAGCVHEKIGCYERVEGEAAVGLVLGTDIDLRVFYRAWAHGFAVHEVHAAGADGVPRVQHSLQFFDATGTAVHKVFARPDTDAAAWQALVARFADTDQRPGLSARPAAPRPPDRPDAEVDVAAFRADWAALRDTHAFFGLLERHRLGRVQALRLADPRFARPVEPGVAGAARELLQAVAGSALPIMVFVGNPGMIQIHTGPVRRVQVSGPWLNVLDPGFNLHLREDLVASAWLVRKPTVDGLVTSLELFDAEGETLAMLFGERKPGRPELAAWRATTARLVGAPDWAEEGACTAC